METTVVGVRFQEAGKIYYFEPGGYDSIDVGSYAVVETSRGVELGRVVIAPGQVLTAELTEPLKPIMRIGTPDDVERAAELKEKAHDVARLARERARALNLPMKIDSAQYTLDGSRVTVFFTSEERVDFRDLIRDLGHHVRAQVQLRQVGPRDQAKLIGGYGRCGRRLCCSSWLTAFPSISIRMAKEQNLPLNPSKISGQCGRLLCCLSYENDIYKQLKHELPKPDSWLSTPGGDARVLSVNAVKQVITLQMQDTRVMEFTVAQLGIQVGVTRPLPGGPGTGDAESEDAGLVPLEVRALLPSIAFPDNEVPAGTGVQPPQMRAAPPRRNPAETRPADRGAPGPGGQQRPRLPQQRGPSEGGQGQQGRPNNRNQGQGRPTQQPQAAAAAGQVPAPRTDLTNSAAPLPQAEGAEAGEAGGNRKRRRRHRGSKKSE